MRRFSCDDYDEMFPNQGELWYSNVQRAIKGKRGQRDLRTLEAVLLALPEKRLIEGRLAKGQDVCAVGAFVLQKRVEAGENREDVLRELARAVKVYCGSCYHTEDEHGTEAGCAKCVENAAAGRYSYACQGFTDEDAETDDYGEETAQYGKRAGMTFTLAWRIGSLNDEDFHGLTPEARYESVLAWVRKHIQEPVPT